MFEFDDCGRRIPAHVFDRILVAEPFGPFDRVVHMPAPVVFTHITERRTNAALRCNGMTAGREDLADARGLQPGGGHAEGRTQSRAAATDHDDVIAVVLDRIRLAHVSRLRVSRSLGPPRPGHNRYQT